MYIVISPHCFSFFFFFNFGIDFIISRTLFRNLVILCPVRSNVARFYFTSEYKCKLGKKLTNNACGECIRWTLGLCDVMRHYKLECTEECRVMRPQLRIISSILQPVLRRCTTSEFFSVITARFPLAVGVLIPKAYISASQQPLYADISLNLAHHCLLLENKPREASKVRAREREWGNRVKCAERWDTRCAARPKRTCESLWKQCNLHKERTRRRRRRCKQLNRKFHTYRPRNALISMDRYYTPLLLNFRALSLPTLFLSLSLEPPRRLSPGSLRRIVN